MKRFYKRFAGVCAGGSARAHRRATSYLTGSGEEREMKLLLFVDSLLIGAPLLAAQRLALVAQSIIGWPFVVDHQVELLWPLRTLLAEMPRLTTSMRAVFHGSTAFPEFAYEEKSSLQRVSVKGRAN